MECGLDEDAQARTLFESGKYEKVLERYEQTSPQPAFLQDE
jgi:hypothetical protein